jgi:hypothetical protein
MEKTDIARAFQIGLGYLWNGRSGSHPGKAQHFCNALLYAHKAGQFSHSQYIAATQFIQQRLGKCCTVIHWLAKQPGFEDIWWQATDKQIQEYRKAWVLSMIKELKNA